MRPSSVWRSQPAAMPDPEPESAQLAWLTMRVNSLRAEYAADDQTERLRGPRPHVYRASKQSSRWMVLLDATLAGALALLLVGAITLILTI